MGQRKRPQSEIRCSVWDCAEHEFNGFNQLMDEEFGETVVCVIFALSVFEIVAVPFIRIGLLLYQVLVLCGLISMGILLQVVIMLMLPVLFALDCLFVLIPWLYKQHQWYTYCTYNEQSLWNLTLVPNEFGANDFAPFQHIVDHLRDYWGRFSLSAFPVGQPFLDNKDVHEAEKRDQEQ